MWEGGRFVGGWAGARARVCVCVCVWCVCVCVCFFFKLTDLSSKWLESDILPERLSLSVSFSQAEARR